MNNMGGTDDEIKGPFIQIVPVSFGMAKNATMKDYRKATGFEALMGYLYLQGETERLVSLVREGLGNDWTEEKKEEDRV